MAHPLEIILKKGPELEIPNQDKLRIAQSTFEKEGARAVGRMLLSEFPTATEETLKWIIDGVVKGGNAQQIIEQFLNPDSAELRYEDFSASEINSLVGTEIAEWLKDSVNMQNILHAYREIYGFSEWGEGTKLKPEYSRFLESGHAVSLYEGKYEYGEREFQEKLITLPEDEKAAFLGAYHLITVQKPIISQKYRLDPQVLVLLALGLPDYMSYYEYESNREKMHEAIRGSFESLFEEYYTNPELIERFKSELVPSETQTPILVVSEGEHDRFGKTLLGFCWLMMYSKNNAAAQIAERIVGANYQQTAELAKVGDAEKERIVEAIDRFVAGCTDDPEGCPICYIDEIAIIPDMQSTGVFKKVFRELISTGAKQGAIESTESNADGAVYFFRTLKGGKLDSITSRIFGDAMPVVYTSKASPDEPEMVYKAIFIVGDVLNMLAEYPDMLYSMFGEKEAVEA